MTSIGPLTPNPFQQIDRPQDLIRPERPERPTDRPGGDEGGRPKVERFRNHLQNQAERLRSAVESGDVDPARARKVRDHISDVRDRVRDRIDNRPDRPTVRPRPDDDGPIDPAKVREHLQNLKERLKNAVNEGDLSPERARKIYQKHLNRAKEALGIGDDDSISPLRVRKHLQHLKGRLQNAVGNGDLSPEQAREIWNQHVERAKKLLGQGDNNGGGNGGNNGGTETPDFETITDAKRGNTLTIEA